VPSHPSPFPSLSSLLYCIESRRSGEEEVVSPVMSCCHYSLLYLASSCCATVSPTSPQRPQNSPMPPRPLLPLEIAEDHVMAMPRPRPGHLLARPLRPIKGTPSLPWNSHRSPKPPRQHLLLPRFLYQARRRCPRHHGLPRPPLAPVNQAASRATSGPSRPSRTWETS
jgi:hypothetical protein